VEANPEQTELYGGAFSPIRHQENLGTEQGAGKAILVFQHPAPDCKAAVIRIYLVYPT